MDSKLKRAQAEEVRRQVDTHLRLLGFTRTKTTFWTRERGPLMEFIHLHLFSFAPAFRIHPGLRVLNDSFEARALNGPASKDADRPSFDSSAQSVVRCAFQVLRYCEVVALPWFARWRDPHALLAAADSPLKTDERDALQSALEGRTDAERETRSRMLFGLS